MTAFLTSGVSMPFDSVRDGFVIGEGAGVVVLEERSRAIARGAHIYAELAGAASTADAHHITAPSPDGNGAARCMELALADAEMSPSDVTHVNSHGTSTPPGDAAEAEAIYKVFGSPGPAVTSDQGRDRPYPWPRRGYRGGCRGAHLEAPPDPPDHGHDRHVDPAFQLDVVIGGPRDWNRGRSLPTLLVSGATTAALCSSRA